MLTARKKLRIDRITVGSMKVKNTKKNERQMVAWRPRVRCPNCGFAGPHYVPALDIWTCDSNKEL